MAHLCIIGDGSKLKRLLFEESEGGFLCCRRGEIASQISLLGLVHSVSLRKSGEQHRASVETEGETETDQRSGEAKTTSLKTQKIREKSYFKG